jgi:hypothetical protein
MVFVMETQCVFCILETYLDNFQAWKRRKIYTEHNSKFSLRQPRGVYDSTPHLWDRNSVIFLAHSLTCERRKPKNRVSRDRYNTARTGLRSCSSTPTELKPRHAVA